MSNHLAIATVTAALAQLVRDATQSAVPGSDVLLGRPEAPAGGAALARAAAVPLPGQPQRRAAQRRPARTECGR